MITINDLEFIVTEINKVTKRLNPPVVTFIAMQSKDPFKILVSTLLSLRTKDEVTMKASLNLFKKAETPESLIKITEEKIAKLIYPVGFYKTKAKNLRKIAEILILEYNSLVPNKMDDLLKFPGVGRKTANLVLIEGYNIPGICVDTHVHRISNRMGIVKTKNPEETEYALMKFLPKNYWIKFNALLVSYGQTICRPLSPHCSKCEINNICPKIGVIKKR